MTLPSTEPALPEVAAEDKEGASAWAFALLALVVFITVAMGGFYLLTHVSVANQIMPVVGYLAIALLVLAALWAIARNLGRFFSALGSGTVEAGRIILSLALVIAGIALAAGVTNALASNMPAPLAGLVGLVAFFVVGGIGGWLGTRAGGEQQFGEPAR